MIWHDLCYAKEIISVLNDIISAVLKENEIGSFFRVGLGADEVPGKNTMFNIMLSSSFVRIQCLILCYYCHL